jgi:putative ABC transport system permease protein
LVLQVGLAVVLLVGAGLMARSLVAVRTLDLGFDPRNVLTFSVNLLRSPRYRHLEASSEFTRDLTRRLSALPSVVSAGPGMVPLRGGFSNGFEIEGRSDEIETEIDVASPGYLHALDFRLRAGRLFTEADDKNGEPVVIVNRAFARTAWGNSEALERHMRASGDPTPLRVVGVVDNTRRSTLEAEPPPIVYLPYLQTTVGFPNTFVVRTSGPPMDVLSAVRDVVRGMDSTIPMTDIETMDDRVEQFVVPREFNLWLIGLFSLLAFGLAIVGLYGLVSELVTERTPEIGLRMALGATRFQILWLVAGGSALVVAAGVAMGLAGAVAVTRSLGSMIFGVRPLDPLTLVLVPVALLVSSVIAAAVPAHRATEVDPVSALRCE